MKKVIITLSLLLLFFVNNVLAYPGVSLKGNGLSFGNIRGDGGIVDGLSLTLGSSKSKWFDKINGLSLSFWTASHQINGIAVNPFYAGSESNITGLVISPLVTHPRKLKGIAVGGLLVRGDITGLTIGSFVGGDFVNVAATIGNSLFTALILFGGPGPFIEASPDSGDTMAGITLSLGLVGGNIKGISIAALSSNANVVSGFVFAPLYNFTQELHGVQIGLINTSNRLHGIQFGLINYAGNNPWYLKILPFFNGHE